MMGKLQVETFHTANKTRELYFTHNIYGTEEIINMLKKEQELQIKYKDSLGRYSMNEEEQKQGMLDLNDYLMNNILRKKGQEIANRELDNGCEYILKLTKEMMNSIEIYKENIKAIKEFSKIKGENNGNK